ncbi:MAG: polysaccharide deacetylase family protein [candidate division KSB1 bacterium]|nr:polysaccharide deacetylase family protein [candidate division KSB1 bacterium]
MSSLAVAQTRETKAPFQWPNGARCAVSLTFDDARLSQVDRGIPLLDRMGVRATFYISPDNAKQRLEGWRAAVAEGHEIGNHTVTHPCTGNYAFSRHNALEDYTLERIEAEIRQANEFIENELGVRAVTFAYPCGQTFVGRGAEVQSYVPLIARLFIAARGWSNQEVNNPLVCDPAQLLAVECDGKSFAELRAWVDKAAREGGWLIFAGHEIGDGGPQTTLVASLEALCRYAADPANAVWIAPVESVARYLIEHR